MNNRIRHNKSNVNIYFLVEIIVDSDTRKQILIIRKPVTIRRMIIDDNCSNERYFQVNVLFSFYGTNRYFYRRFRTNNRTKQ
jgi:hypothetical protein